MTERKDPRAKLWTAWTDNDVETLKRLWREKNSASVIAAALSNSERKYTRNAVIGKINRLGLQGQGQLAPKLMKSNKRKPGAQEPAPTPTSVSAANAAQEIAKSLLAALTNDILALETIEDPAKVDLPVSGRVTLFDLAAGVCRYPIGDPLADDFTFCGDACDITRSYCETHHAVAYNPIQKQKKVAWRAYR